MERELVLLTVDDFDADGLRDGETVGEPEPDLDAVGDGEGVDEPVEDPVADADGEGV